MLLRAGVAPYRSAPGSDRPTAPEPRQEDSVSQPEGRL